MGYALFAQKKLTLCGMLNTVQMQQSQRSDEQLRLATRSLSLKNRISSLQSAQSSVLGDLYEQLSQASDSSARDDINTEIQKKENEFDLEIEKLNRQVNDTSNKENAIEMEVKRLDTKVTALQKQLDALQEAEGNGIDKATPKFKGIG